MSRQPDTENDEEAAARMEQHRGSPRVMYYTHVLFRVFVSLALIQGVTDYKYRQSINEVSHLFYLLFIPIFIYLADTICGVSSIKVSHMYSHMDTASRCRIGAS
jgi:hypothetical protein